VSSCLFTTSQYSNTLYEVYSAIGFLLSEHDQSYLWTTLLYQGKVLTAHEDLKRYTCMYISKGSLQDNVEIKKPNLCLKINDIQ